MKKMLISLLITLGFSIEQALAAVPTGVSTALTDLKADVETIGGLAFAAFVAIVLFRYMRSATK